MEPNNWGNDILKEAAQFLVAELYSYEDNTLKASWRFLVSDRTLQQENIIHEFHQQLQFVQMLRLDI